MVANRAERLRVTIREYEPGDEEAILAGFNVAFAEIDPNFHPRPIEVWRWRYEWNPAGWRIWLGVTDDGEVVGQQAGMPIRMLQDGERVTWNQVGDTFVDPRRQSGLRTLFRDVAQPYSDNYGGPAPGQDPVLYGMPVRRALRVGAKQLHYQVVRTQNKLSVAPDELRTAAAPGVEVEEVERFPEEVAALSLRVAEEHRAIAIRDTTYLDWRFLRHPELSYSIALARRGGELVGYAVYRAAGFDGRDDALVADWCVPHDEEGASEALRAWLGEKARADDQEHLTAIFPETCEPWLAFQRAGFRVHPTGYYAVGRCYADPYDMRWVYRHWYYTLGDFDLV